MPKKREQISFEDHIVTNPEVQELLEARENAKDGATAFRQADRRAREALGKIEDGKPYRIGRFIISEVHIEAKEVAFATDETDRVKISTVD